jgi:hypothetical protein
MASGFRLTGIHRSSESERCAPVTVGRQIWGFPISLQNMVGGKCAGNTQSKRKLVNLPSAKKIRINMDHITSGHMKGGSRLSPGKSLFPEGWSHRQVERAIMNAYKTAKRTQTQESRLLVRGTSNGVTIDIWINVVTKTIETAYPV